MKKFWALINWNWTFSLLNSFWIEEKRRRRQQFHLTRILSAAWMKRSRSLLPHPNTSMQNSEEYSQERKFSTLQAQNQRDGLRGPNMSYRPQQLNFAVWCAPTGCGISREVLDKVLEQIESFLMCHIYFIVRTILFEMGGIQRESALPGELTFNQVNNNWHAIVQTNMCRIWNFIEYRLLLPRRW